MASNSKPAAELRIGAVKATVWENEVGGITRHNVTFSRIYRNEDQWKTTHSFGFKNLLTLAQARRSGAHAHCRAQRRGRRDAGGGSPLRGQGDRRQRRRGNGRTFRRRVHPRRLFKVCRPGATPELRGSHGYWLRPRPTHKAGDPGIGKDSEKVSRGFPCRSLFWEQSEQFSVFRLQQESIEILQDGLFHFRFGTEFLHHAVT